MDEIERLFEKYLCMKMTGLVPGHMFVPMSGSGESEDAQPMEPPFTVITINSADKVMAQYGQWRMQGSAQVVTHMDESISAAHSQLARLIYKHLSNLNAEVAEDLVFHGIDITGVRSVEESTNKVRVSAIDFTAGVAG